MHRELIGRAEATAQEAPNSAERSLEALYESLAAAAHESIIGLSEGYWIAPCTHEPAGLPAAAAALVARRTTEGLLERSVVFTPLFWFYAFDGEPPPGQQFDSPGKTRYPLVTEVQLASAVAPRDAPTSLLLSGVCPIDSAYHVRVTTDQSVAHQVLEKMAEGTGIRFDVQAVASLEEALLYPRRISATAPPRPTRDIFATLSYRCINKKIA